MKISFYSNQLCLRGTEVSLYNYAKYNEEILGNQSVIVSQDHTNMDALVKFKNRFKVDLLPFHNIENYIKDERPDWIYITKSGFDDGYLVNSIPCLIHAVFQHNQPHGDRYVYISDWLARNQGYDPQEYSLPYIVENSAPTNENFKQELNIPNKAIVFGCYGGQTQFDILSTHEVIKRVVNERNDIYFLFMNINKFCDDHPRIIHLPGTWNMEIKSKFINTCDVMIHGRLQGETFGMAVAEFTIKNKPVITYALSEEKCHIEMLGERGIYYTGCDDLYDIVNNLNDYIKFDDYYNCYKNNTPEKIMKIFERIIKH